MRYFIDDDRLYKAPGCNRQLLHILCPDLKYHVADYTDDQRIEDLIDADNVVFQEPGHVFDAKGLYRREDSSLWLVGAVTVAMKLQGYALVITDMCYDQKLGNICIRTILTPLPVLHAMERRKIIDDLLGTI